MPEPRTLVVLDLDRTLLFLDLHVEELRATIGRLFAEIGIETELTSLFDGLELACQAASAREPGLGDRLRAEAWGLIDAEELRAARTCRLAEGARELLAALEGSPVAIYSNNHAAAVHQALEHTGLDPRRFLTIQARETAASLKPSPEPILAALRAAGGPSAIDRLFVVGDHPVDMRAARLAAEALARERWPGAVLPVGLRGPRRDRALEEEGAWFLAVDLAEAARLITTPRSPHTLSIVLLAYNEERAIARAVLDARRFLQLYLDRGEVIVVDDGSTDATAARTEQAAGSSIPVRVLRHTVNQGMGAAMRTGYRAASMDYIAHLPGDRQVRPQALAPLLADLAPDRVVLTHYTLPPSGRPRQLVSLIFRLLVHTVGAIRVNFAGTYLFHRRWLPLLDGHRVGSDTFVFSFELLEELRRAGCELADHPISCFPRTDGGASRELLARRIVGVAVEILRSRWRRVRG